MLLKFIHASTITKTKRNCLEILYLSLVEVRVSDVKEVTAQGSMSLK